METGLLRNIGAVLGRDAQSAARSQTRAALDGARTHLLLRKKPQQTVIGFAHPQNARACRQDLILLVRIEHPAGTDVDDKIRLLHRLDDDRARHRPSAPAFKVVRDGGLDDLAGVGAEILRGREKRRRILRIGERIGIDDHAFAFPHFRTAKAFTEERDEIGCHIRRGREADHDCYYGAMKP
jgi:hypothetical protein